MQKLLFIPLLVSGLSSLAGGATADSAKGSEVFEAQGCIQCHSLDGVGATVGPDLGQIAGKGFTPATLAAAMWNHAPAMWTEGKLRNFVRPAMDEQQAADLFAFFYSMHFFDEPGDAGRGKKVFASKKCEVCHGASTTKSPAARPVTQWNLNGDPVDLAEQMWNHSAEMHQQMDQHHVQLPHLKSQDLADLMAYARRSSGKGKPAATLRLAATDQGKALFETKGCAACHGAATHFLALNIHPESLTGIATDMWNHGLDMRLKDTKFAPGEMREIAAYIWFSRANENAGEVTRGAQVFTANKCDSCHADKTKAPRLGGLAANGQFFSGATMAAALTQHGPQMLAKMQEQKIAWPHIKADDMSALIAYLNSRPGR